MEQLLKKCLAGKRTKFTITGSTILKFHISPFITWCDAFAPPEEKEPQGKYMHLLFERGLKHEKKVLSLLYSNAVKVPLLSFETGFKQVLDECKKGTEILTGAPLFYMPENIYGITDILQRDNSHSSIFGNYHYVVKEIKSAKHIKNAYIMQAAFYTHILGKVQGFTPKKFFLINREKQEFAYEYEQYREPLMHALKGIKEILDGKEISPTAKSCRWPWGAYCNKRAIQENDVSIIPNVGSALKQKLNEAGIMTVKQLATQPINLDVPEATLNKIKLHAQAWYDKKPIVITKPELPKSDVELFLDFEGTDELETEEGMVKVDYLIGLLVKDKEIQYHSFVSENLANEAKMFHDFLAYIKKYPDAPIYHYGPYERTHLAVLGEKYKVDVSHLLKNLVDVLYILKKSVALPTLTMSLKEVSKFLGFSYRGMADAQESIVLYLKFIDTKEKELLNRIIDYNEDDVMATLVVKDYLSTLA